jgi:gamma-glutamyl-gamma-aminobutyrate hydrolase PuuD
MTQTKLIGVTQRVDVVASYNERRDCLDQRWVSFLQACGLTLVPIPNSGAAIAEWLSVIKPFGLVLSGGNDLAALGGDAPERDATENALIDWARLTKVPVVGVCRGMQLLAHRSGCSLERRDGHVAKRHIVHGQTGSKEVNSYHSWCVNTLSGDWTATAKCEDGTVESFRHQSLPHVGVMWHPEREASFHAEDIEFFRNQFRALA